MAHKKLCWQCEKPVKRISTASGTMLYQCTDPDCGWIGENPMTVDVEGSPVRPNEDRPMKAVKA